MPAILERSLICLYMVVFCVVSSEANKSIIENSTQEILSDGSVKFTVMVSSHYIPTMGGVEWWWRKGHDIYARIDQLSDEDKFTATVLQGEGSTMEFSLTIHDLDPDDLGTYRCRVLDGTGRVKAEEDFVLSYQVETHLVSSGDFYYETSDQRTTPIYTRGNRINTSNTTNRPRHISDNLNPSSSNSSNNESNNVDDHDFVSSGDSYTVINNDDSGDDENLDVRVKPTERQNSRDDVIYIETSQPPVTVTSALPPASAKPDSISTASSSHTVTPRRLLLAGLLLIVWRSTYRPTWRI